MKLKTLLFNSAKLGAMVTILIAFLVLAAGQTAVYNENGVSGIKTMNLTGEMNATNYYFGIGVLNRPFITVTGMDTTKTACAGGCDYDTLQDAINDVPLFLDRPYEITLSNGTCDVREFDENVTIPQLYGDKFRIGHEGELNSLRIIGCNNTNSSVTRVRSISITGAHGTLPIHLTGMELYGENPNDDEETALSIYGGSGGVALRYVSFDCSDLHRGITVYNGQASLDNITFYSYAGATENCSDYGINTKYNSQVIIKDDGVHGSVSGYGIGTSKGGLIINTDDSTLTGTLGNIRAVIGLVNDAKTLYGIDELAGGGTGGDITITNDLYIGSKVAHDDDTNTYMTFPDATDTIQFYAGALEFLELKESTVDKAIFNDAGEKIDFYVESDSYDSMLFINGTDNKMGINTTNPSHILSVSGSINATGTLYGGGLSISGTPTFTNLNLDGILYHTGDTNTYMSFPAATDTIELYAGAVEMVQLKEGAQDTFKVNADNADVDFYVGTTINDQSIFVEGNTGRVGINTITPLSTLDVNGQITALGFSGNGENLTGITASVNDTDISVNNVTVTGNGVFDKILIGDTGHPDTELEVVTTQSRGVAAHYISSNGAYIWLTDSGVQDWAIGAKNGGNFSIYRDRYTGGDGTEILHIQYDDDVEIIDGDLVLQSGKKTCYDGNACTVYSYYNGTHLVHVG